MSNRRFAPTIFIILGLVGLMCLAPDGVLAQACAMCKTALSDHDPITRGFNWSILFMMATPYVIFGSVAGWILYTSRRRPGRRVVTSAR